MSLKVIHISEEETPLLHKFLVCEAPDPEMDTEEFDKWEDRVAGAADAKIGWDDDDNPVEAFEAGVRFAAAVPGVNPVAYIFDPTAGEETVFYYLGAGEQEVIEKITYYGECEDCKKKIPMRDVREYSAETNGIGGKLEVPRVCLHCAEKKQ